VNNYDASLRRAQAAYDAMTPPDDGPSECPECDGCGRLSTFGEGDGSDEDCETCGGSGYINEDGSPFINPGEDE